MRPLQKNAAKHAIEEIPILAGQITPLMPPVPAHRSIFTKLMIDLNALCSMARNHAGWQPFNDEIIVMKGVSDVLHAIDWVRDGLCHPEREKFGAYRQDSSEGSRIELLVIQGNMALWRGGPENPHADDLAVFFGPQRLFWKRHLTRAFTEARAKLLPFLD